MKSPFLAYCTLSVHHFFVFVHFLYTRLAPSSLLLSLK